MRQAVSRKHSSALDDSGLCGSVVSVKIHCLTKTANPAQVAVAVRCESSASGIFGDCDESTVRGACSNNSDRSAVCVYASGACSTQSGCQRRDSNAVQTACVNCYPIGSSWPKQRNLRHRQFWPVWLPIIWQESCHGESLRWRQTWCAYLVKKLLSVEPSKILPPCSAIATFMLGRAQRIKWSSPNANFVMNFAAELIWSPNVSVFKCNAA